MLYLHEDIFSRVNKFHAQLVLSFNVRCQVTFADYALNHPSLQCVVHKLSSDTSFAMALSKSLVVTIVSKIHNFFMCTPTLSVVGGRVSGKFPDKWMEGRQGRRQKKGWGGGGLFFYRTYFRGIF